MNIPRIKKCFSFNSENTESVIFETVKEKKIFITGDWQGGRRNLQASHRSVVRNEDGSSTNSAASRSFAQNGQRGRQKNQQQNGAPASNPFPEDKYILHVH